MSPMNAADHWWAFALRGMAAVIFGILALLWPDLTLGVLVLLWGAYALADGILALAGAFRTPQDHRLPLVVEGVVGIAAGLAALFWPGLTAFVLLYTIAAWAFLTGALEVESAMRLRKVIENEWWLGLSGIASVLFGVALVIAPGPGAGALALIWLIGVYAIAFGALLIALAFRLRGYRQRHQFPATA